jgi:glucose/arabinose dehydrogenase
MSGSLARAGLARPFVPRRVFVAAVAGVAAVVPDGVALREAADGDTVTALVDEDGLAQHQARAAHVQAPPVCG